MIPPVSQRLPYAPHQTRRSPPAETRAEPSVGVVLASRSDFAFLRAGLGPLVQQCDSAGFQLLVVRRRGAIEPFQLAVEFPSVRVVDAEPQSDLRAMRGMGMAAAAADITIMLDDRALPLSWEHRISRTRSVLNDSDAVRDHKPRISVVVPAHQANEPLEVTLGALEQSDLPRGAWELIVVDDASTDGSSFVAAQYADVIIRLSGSGRFGPAYARNRGAELASADALVFIDADVRVRRDTLSSIGRAFDELPGATAIIGSYDATPSLHGVVSDYRNLLQHYIHQQNAGSTDVFWGGCGAVRRAAFLEAGGYDEWRFPRPQVEDIELGHRMRAAGRAIVLRPEIQATHLKRWTLRSLIATDIWDQGVPWVRVVSQRAAKRAGRVLGPRGMDRMSTLLVACAVALAAVSLGARDASLLWGALAALMGIVFNNRHQIRFFVRARSVRFALVSIGLDLIYYSVSGVAVAAGWLLREILGEPRPDPLTEAYSEVGVKRWPPVRTKPATSTRRPAPATLS